MRARDLQDLLGAANRAITEERAANVRTDCVWGPLCACLVLCCRCIELYHNEWCARVNGVNVCVKLIAARGMRTCMCVRTSACVVATAHGIICFNFHVFWLGGTTLHRDHDDVGWSGDASICCRFFPPRCASNACTPRNCFLHEIYEYDLVALPRVCAHPTMQLVAHI